MKRIWSEDETERLTSMYRSGISEKEIADTLLRTRGSIRNKLDDLGIRGTRNKPSVDQTSVIEHDDKSEVVWTTSTPVRTTEDALAKAEIDTAVWEVERSVINSWEVGAKTEKGDIAKTPLWQVKLWLKRKKGWSRKELLAEIVESLGRPVRKAKPSKVVKPSGLLAEVAIMDHHFGKLAWQPEVGENYDVEIARDRYDKAARVLIDSCEEQNAKRILFVVGNDFYHVDNGTNTTTAGTPQDCDGRWQKAFVTGLTCVRDAIEAAKEVAPVDVMVVPGNHDKERAFTLGVTLGAVYGNDGRVTVHNSPSLKKRFAWGVNLLGFYHGHKMRAGRLAQLPNEMAHAWPQEFAASQWREWHLGHLHRESEDVWRFRASDTQGDMLVRVLPSLCGTDAWHHESGYRSLGAAETHFFDSKFGRVGYRSISQLALEQL